MLSVRVAPAVRIASIFAGVGDVLRRSHIHVRGQFVEAFRLDGEAVAPRRDIGEMRDPGIVRLRCDGV